MLEPILANRLPSWVGAYWGKARRNGNIVPHGPDWHPLAWHMLDVAATTGALLAARPLLLINIARSLKLKSAEAMTFLVWLAAVHDLGKFAPPFQAKVLDLCERLQGTPPSTLAGITHHDGDGVAFFRHVLSEKSATDRFWQHLNPRDLMTLATASFCHHGSPTEPTKNLSIEQLFGDRGLADATACLSALSDLLMPDPMKADPLTKEEACAASYLVAGTITAADWLGSSQIWFPYRAPDIDLNTYWQLAQERAAKAVKEAGYAAATPSMGQNFQMLTGKTTPPTPLQRWALDVNLIDRPTLFILEDVTGAGKTEAAHILVHRLMLAGRASGAFWAMPTMATANAMYARQQNLIAGLFDPDGPEPSLALAHGQARLHKGFQNSKLEIGREEDTFGNDQADITASAACNAFLGDDKRLSLLADIGAGTVDQALLAVLPSRFNTVRLMGLSEKVLVIDEAHAYDAYVGQETMRLLEFHQAGGGSAIVLSATLPNDKRADLVAMWQGFKGQRKADARLPFDEKRYPLATLVADEHLITQEIAPAPWSARSLPVRLVADASAILSELCATLVAGGCAAWVRNTVDDVLEAAEMARAAGVEPLIFHARSAQSDRQRIEAEVMGLFGPVSSAAKRQGRLVIATQVIEQSLDIDFDQMASDIAPIDLIIQRAGRMRRHTRSDRPDKVGDALLVLCPPFMDEPDSNWIKAALPGAAAVYADHAVLWRTARELALRGALTVPNDLRDLVEAVYSNEAHCPPALMKSRDEALGKSKGQAQTAGNMLLKVHSGYLPGFAYQSELKIQTRDATEQSLIRLAKRDSKGKIVPWATGQSDTDWQDWALSEVKAPLRLVPLDAKSLPELEADLAPIRATWGRFEREIAVCVLVDVGGGVWRGEVTSRDRIVTVQYSHSHGLLSCT